MVPFMVSFRLSCLRFSGIPVLVGSVFDSFLGRGGREVSLPIRIRMAEACGIGRIDSFLAVLVGLVGTCSQNL